MNAFNPFVYLKSLNPAEFDSYSAPKGVGISAKQIKMVVNFLHQLPSDRNMLLYFWRFVYGMDIKTIRRFAGVEHANGVIEAMRFTCKRMLEMEKTISNAGMGKAFELLLPDYEIILVTLDKGICWRSGQALDAGLISKSLDQHSHG